jgi:hypothetical protein
VNENEHYANADVDKTKAELAHPEIVSISADLRRAEIDPSAGPIKAAEASKKLSAANFAPERRIALKAALSRRGLLLTD